MLAQNTFKVIIRDSETNEPLSGATVLVKGTQNKISANENGIAEIKNIPDGNWVLLFSFVGYEEQTHTFHPRHQVMLWVESQDHHWPWFWPSW